MKKILIALLFNFLFCSTLIAETYYFKGCKLTEVLHASYFIDFNKNSIKVVLEAVDGTFQEFSDPIEFVEKDKVVSKKIQSGKSKDSFFIYYLDSNSRSVIKQNYKKGKGELGIIRPEGSKQQSYCIDVKADWNVGKIEISEKGKEQEQTQKIQEEILKNQSSTLKCQGNNFKEWTNCIGSHSAKNGFKFIGKFIDGKIVEGTVLYPGNAKYVGQLKNDLPHGQGNFTFSDGSKYYGEWRNGKGEGNGTKTWRDGRKYSGKFKNDKPHGQGTFNYPDGSNYVGQWKNGKRHGDGTHTYADGRVYIGEFIDGQEHGKGTCFKKDGKPVNCQMDISSTGRNTHNIIFSRDKWIKLSEFENASGKAKKTIDLLKNEFNKKAIELCSSTENFDILKKNIKIIEEDETPAIGLETVVKLGIDGVIECKK